MLLHDECGTQFTNDLGDVEERYPFVLGITLGNTAGLLFESPKVEALNMLFSNRFIKLEHTASRLPGNKP